MITQVLLGYFVCTLALLTVFCHLAQIVGISFDSFASTSAVIVLLSAAVTVVFAGKKISNINDWDFGPIVILIITGLICSALAIFSHRSDGDDLYYLPNVVYLLNDPSEVMGFAVHFLDAGENCEIVSYAWGTALAFEYIQGAVAYFLGVDFLTVYYLYTPALVSFLIAFALYYALSFFADKTVAAAIGALVTIGVLLYLGETRLTFGNFFLTRIYQGKAVMLSLGIPLFIGFSLQFFKAPSVFYWALLAATATAMVGATASAIPVLLSLGVVLAFATMLSRPFVVQKLQHYTIYFSSFIYAVIYAVLLYVGSASDLGTDSVVNHYWPTSFWGHLNFFIHAQRPITPIILAVSTFLSIYLSSGRERVFLIFWICGAAILFLNPLVAPFIIKYLTSPNIYWRLFYIYPFPMVVGISVIRIIERRQCITVRNQIVVAIMAPLILTGGHFLPFSSSIFRYNTIISLSPNYKLPAEYVSIARDIISKCPPGTMLAPPELSGIIPLLSSQHPQMRIRTEGVRLWMRSCGKPALAGIRIGASEFAGGDFKQFADFKDLLDREGEIIQSLVMHEKLITDDQVAPLLEGYQFIHQGVAGSYRVFWK